MHEFFAIVWLLAIKHDQILGYLHASARSWLLSKFPGQYRDQISAIVSNTNFFRRVVKSRMDAFRVFFPGKSNFFLFSNGKTKLNTLHGSLKWRHKCKKQCTATDVTYFDPLPPLPCIFVLWLANVLSSQNCVPPPLFNSLRLINLIIRTATYFIQINVTTTFND